ncbi:unnamed protein product [Linum trigynum]|uniref:DUF4283 domain-containing protein n=1 Tax=Linum trigynum TaxID=586398 RepID=A0AAV2CAB0_9ROSI
MEVDRKAMVVELVVESAIEDIESVMKWAHLSLLGRLFMDNPLSLTLLQKIVNGAWECAPKVKVLEAEMGLIKFFFGSEGYMNWVLQRSPWPIKDHVLHLQHWQPITQEVVDSFIHVPFGFRCGVFLPRGGNQYGIGIPIPNTENPNAELHPKVNPNPNP